MDCKEHRHGQGRGAGRTKYRSGVKNIDKYPVDLHKILNSVFVQLFGDRPVATSMREKIQYNNCSFILRHIIYNYI